jgi:hypothetical protein
MRAREFIVEYKHDITKKNWFEKIWQRGMVDRTFTPQLHNMLKDEWLAYEQAKQDNDQARVEQSVDSMDQWVTTQIQALERADPSPNKQYVQWMLRLWTNPHGVSRIEDITSTTAEMLHRYHELKQRNKLPQELRDINRFQTSLSLEKLHDEVDRLYDLLNKADAAAMPKGNAREVWNDSNFRIIVPEDEAAACYYGQGTRWCTAATKGHNLFDHYTENGPIYIVIPKKAEYEGEKYQLHGSTYQVMNERDQPVYINKLLTRFPSLKQVLPKIDTNRDDFSEWTELLSDADIDDGVGTWNAWANKQLQEWILQKLLTRWIAAHRAEFASPQQTYEKISRAILDIAADSEVSLQDFYRTAERIHEKGDTAVTDLGAEFTRLMATAWQEHLINTASNKYSGKNAPVSLDHTEWEVMIKTLRDIAGRLMDEDVTAAWGEDEGWEFNIFDYSDLEFADTENEEEP